MKKFSAENLAENYLWCNEPICREERQYALFMYKRLMDLVGKEIIIKDNTTSPCTFWLDKDLKSDGDFLAVCGLKEGKVKIKEVFYEVTFMRDFFQYYKSKDGSGKGFNESLINFVKSKEENPESFDDWENDLDKNLGMLPIADKEQKLHIKVRNMMNSKPDIGILYEQGDCNYMRFLECKYLSKQGKQNGELQYDIQNNILNFLCKYVFENVEAHTSNENEIIRFCNHIGKFKSYTNVKIADISSYCKEYNR